MAIFVPTRQRAYYFDSFGDEPNEQLKGFLKTFPQVVRNTNTLQAISSNYCGHYCIFFVFNMSLAAYNRLLAFRESRSMYRVIMTRS